MGSGIKKGGERLYYWDNVKFILILAVVVGHFADTTIKMEPDFKSVFVFIWSFHMPLFIFVSGLFSKSAVGENLKSGKVIYFAVLFWLLKICLSIENIVFSKPAKFDLFVVSNIPWYMIAMVFWMILTYLLRNANRRFVMVGSIAAALAIGFFPEAGDFLAVSRVIVYFPFFIAGYYMNPEYLAKSIKKRRAVWVAGAVCLIVFLLICVFGIDKIYFIRPMLTGRNSYMAFDMKWEGLIVRILVFVLAVIISFAVLAVVPRGKTWFSSLGTRTLQVYFLHRIVLGVMMDLGIREYLMQTCGEQVWGIIWLLLGVALTFVLSARCFQYPFVWLEQKIGQIVSAKGKL